DLREQQEWMERRQRTPRHLNSLPQERISRLLAKSESGDLDAWWQLNMEMTVKPTDMHYQNELEPDLTVLPGWKDADQATRGRILEAAKRYLAGREASPDRWYKQDNFSRPDLAGYRAVRLLAHEEPLFIRTLPVDIWKKWAVAILGYPTIVGGPD